MKIFTVDAFTEKLFAGNPAGVCLLEKEIDEELMQNIAAEMNLSETAFIRKIDDGFSLRWFTPKAEVELCGHATLASSHILWQESILKPDEEAVFHTLYKGVLTAKWSGDEISLDFPINVPQSVEISPELEKALGKRPQYLLATTGHHYLAIFKSEAEVRDLKPDFDLLKNLPKYGVIVSSKSDDPKYDFVSRYFVPLKGINEDPVTGSAHCVLAPYWSKQLNKKEMNAYQASERGGQMKVVVENDRVFLIGKALTVLKGDLL